MTTIRVDLEQLRQATEQYAAIAQRLLKLQWDLEESARSAPSYDGQFGPKVQGLQADLTVSIQKILERLVNASEYLAQKAEGFAAADAAASDGFYQLALSIRMTIDHLSGVSTLPRWLRLGQRPPWEGAAEWRKLPVDDQEAVLESYRRLWAQFIAGRTAGSFRASQVGLPFLEEMFSIYLFGLPVDLFVPATGKQRAPLLPAAPLFALPSLPDGRVYGFNRHQYQNLQDYIQSLRESANPRDWDLAKAAELVQSNPWSTRHFNLCGLDAAGYTVGVQNMMEVYVAYAAVNEAMLISNDTAWTYEIRNLYRELGWEAEQIGRFASTEDVHWVHWDEGNRLAFPTFGDVQEKLAQGYAITPLVGVDSAAGTLSADPDAAVGHFVTISETMVTQDGTQLIRVYNSLEHREEIYTWEWFDQIWQNAGGNSGGQAVIARPSEAAP